MFCRIEPLVATHQHIRGLAPSTKTGLVIPATICAGSWKGQEISARRLLDAWMRERAAQVMTPEMATNLLCKVGEDRDEQAFQQLFDEFAARLKSYMMRHGADSATADDIAQEAFATIWRKAHLFDPGKGTAITWIFRVARNLRIDRIRKERVWQPLPEEHQEQASQDRMPDEAVAHNEQQNAVREALQVLPPEQLEVIELSYMAGMSQSEVSEHLGIPIGTVKSRMRLAYTKLQPILQKAR